MFITQCSNDEYVRMFDCKSTTIGKGTKPRCRSLSADETCRNSLNPQQNIGIIALLIQLLPLYQKLQLHVTAAEVN